MTPTNVDAVEPHSGLARLDAWLIGATSRIASIGVAGVLAVAFLNVGDVISRSMFKYSLYGLNEINALLVAIAVTACLPAGMARRVSIKIDLLDRLAPTHVANWFRAFGAALLALFLFLLMWRLSVVAALMNEQNETTIMTRIPTSPFFWAATVGFGAAFGMQMIVAARAFAHALDDARGPGVPILILVAGITLAFAAVLTGLLPPGVFAQLRPDEPMMLALIIFLVMWVAIILSVPLGPAMGLAGIIGAGAVLGLPPALTVMGSEAKRYLSQDALSVLPLFLLMGTFASVAGVGSDIYKLAYALFGHMRGGLAHATILGCAAFGALTGSSLATQVTIGKVAMPEMRARGYAASLSAGSIAAGGTLGQLVPPGTAMILYAVMANESVGALFVGAVFPGILATILYMASVAVWVMIWPEAAPRGMRASALELAQQFRNCWGALILFGLVIGGIYGGIFTNLEAGSVGAAGAFLLAVLRGKITRKTIWPTMAEATGTIALMYTLMFGTALLSFFFGIVHLPDFFLGIVEYYKLSPMGIILFLIGAYLVLGTIMDPWAMMVITVPIFAPIVAKAGFDPTWWGIMTVICMEAGMIHPPLGINLFVLKSMQPEIPMSVIYRGCWPFFIATLVKIALLIIFPAIITWLPSSM